MAASTSGSRPAGGCVTAQKDTDTVHGVEEDQPEFLMEPHIWEFAKVVSFIAQRDIKIAHEEDRCHLTDDQSEFLDKCRVHSDFLGLLIVCTHRVP